MGALDLVIGLYSENADPMTPEKDLRLYRLVTMIWAPLQIVMIFGLIWYVQTVSSLGGGRNSAFFAAVGADRNGGHHLRPRVDAPEEPAGTAPRRYICSPRFSIRISAPNTCWCITATWAPPPMR
jgi:hypothetical protein